MGSARRFIAVGPLAYDIRNGSVSVSGQARQLSWRDLLILEMLLRRGGHPVSKERILNELLLDGRDLSPNGLEVAVYRLRKKICSPEVRIACFRGLGYCLEHASR